LAKNTGLNLAWTLDQIGSITGAATTAFCSTIVSPAPMPPAATVSDLMPCLSLTIVSSMSVTDFGDVKATFLPARSLTDEMPESGVVTQRISPAVRTPV
jgi:hypothetical protein